GVTIAPETSRSSFAGPSIRDATAATRPFAKPTSHVASSPCAGSITRPPRRIRSMGSFSLLSFAGRSRMAIAVRGSNYPREGAVVVDNAHMTGIATGEPRRLVLHWVLFFVVALGIGYPALSRFDPRTVPGCADASRYYEMVVGEPKAASQ